MIKIAIVGTGAIAAAHIRAISKLPQCELVALCDLNEVKVKELADGLGVPYFLNYKDILTAVDVDAVILNLPHGLHVSASVFFLEAGVHVLVEKPMANTLEECDAMIAAAEKTGKKLAIAHVQRFFGVNREVKKIIDSGVLGRLCMYTEQRSINYFLPTRPAWFTDKKMAGGGIVINYGAHAFDRLFYTTGASFAIIRANYANYANERDVEGHAQILATLDNGISASITFSGYSTVVYDIYYYFTGGALHLNGTDSIEMKKEGETEWTAIIPECNENEFVLEIGEFYKYIQGDPSEIPDAQYGRSIIRAIENVYKS